MNKVLCAVLTTVLVLSFVSCGKASTYEDGVFTGYGDGFGGELAVTVTVAGGKITNVSVDSHSETNGIGTPAIEQLPAMIVKANSTDVDAVAGATVTGNAIIFAVNNALDPEKYSSSKKEVEVVAQVASDLYLGVGASLKGGTLNNGADNEGTPYYYLNHIFANTLFDEAGTILAITIDQME
ncbi:MAG: FMN-binding protein, partial [Spirochaetales bacterium]